MIGNAFNRELLTEEGPLRDWAQRAQQRPANLRVGDGKRLAGEPRLVADGITQRVGDRRKAVGVLREIIAFALGEQPAKYALLDLCHREDGPLTGEANLTFSVLWSRTALRIFLDRQEALKAVGLEEPGTTALRLLLRHGEGGVFDELGETLGARPLQAPSYVQGRLRLRLAFG